MALYKYLKPKYAQNSEVFARRHRFLGPFDSVRASHRQIRDVASPHERRTAAAMSVYVRLKRESRTIFLTVEPSDTFGAIKAKVGLVWPSAVIAKPEAAHAAAR